MKEQAAQGLKITLQLNPRDTSILLYALNEMAKRMRTDEDRVLQIGADEPEGQDRLATLAASIFRIGAEQADRVSGQIKAAITTALAEDQAGGR
jgi:hypothetical protein